MTRSSTNNQSTSSRTNQFPTFVFDELCEPGAYICNWSGHLLRVPEDGVTAGRSPMLSIVGPDPLTVTRISPDPFITVTKARLLASNADVSVNF